MIVRIVVNRGSNIFGGSFFSQHGSIISRCYPGMTLVSHRCKASQKSAEEEIDLDAPIKFSTSRAATWKSRETYSGKQTEVNKRPWVPLVSQLPVRTFCSCTSPIMDSRISAVLLKSSRCQGRITVRFVNSWHRRVDRGLKTHRPLILTLTLGVFMAYFMMLRQPSNIDEFLSRPIWERVPGIDPERAEQMMEMDRNLGLQVDKTGLEEYKKKYYAEKLRDIENEEREKKRHRELREAMSSHQGMLKDYAERKNAKE